MAAPRRPNTPVLVLDRHRIPGTNTFFKRESGRQGHETLFGRSKLKKEQFSGSDRMFEGENGTESSTEKGRPSQIVTSVLPVSETLPLSKEATKPAEDALSSLCARRPPQSVPAQPRMPAASTPVTSSLSPSAAMSCLPPPITPPPSPGFGTRALAPAPTAATTALSRTIYTILTHSTPPAAPVSEGGARVEIESFPGQNQVDPNTGDAQIGVPTLPGINQDTSNMGELSRIPSSTVTTGLRGPSSIPAITVNRPLPGQNQANPIMAEPANPPRPPLPPPPPPPSPPPSSLPLINEPVASLFSSSESPKSLAPAISTSTALSVSTLSVQTLSVPRSRSLIPAPTTSFVTITRLEQGKEESPITVALSGITPASATSASFSTTIIPTPQAIEIAQSFPGLLSSTTAIAAATLMPTALSGGQQDGSILHPTARTLLIMFVILGALSIVVAIVIYMMIKSNKKRSQRQQQALAIQYPYDASNLGLGVTTHISTNPNDNPFLTASEKAIIDRAASSDGTSDATSQSSISDAISSFIKKSRRLTYKISP